MPAALLTWGTFPGEADHPISCSWTALRAVQCLGAFHKNVVWHCCTHKQQKSHQMYIVSCYICLWA